MVWWQGLPGSRTADVVAPNENSPIRNGANTLPISAAFEAAADQEIAYTDAAVRSPRPWRPTLEFFSEAALADGMVAPLAAEDGRDCANCAWASP